MSSLTVDTARRWAPRIGAVLLGLLLVFLVVLPMGAVLLASFSEHVPRLGEPLEFTLNNYARLWAPDSVSALRNSLLTSAGGTIMATAVGSTLAVLQSRTNALGKPVIAMAGIVPLFVTALIGALAWGVLASPRAGLLNVLLESAGIPMTLNIYSHWGIIFVFGLYYAPYTYLFVSSALNLMDPQLEESASVHGASNPRTLLEITLPAATPAIVGGGLISFVLMMENFSVPALLGARNNINTVSTQIYYLVKTAGFPTRGAAIGIVLVVMMAVLLIIQRRYQSKRDYATVTGKGLRPKLVDLGSFRPIALVLSAGYLFMAVVLPLLALANVAFRPFAYIGSLSAIFDPTTLTAATVTRVAQSNQFQVGLRNSLLVGGEVAIFGGLLAFLLAYLVARTKLRGRGSLRAIAMGPLAIPGLLMGMGFLWAWLPLPLPLYGTVTILTLAYVARFMPQGYTGASSVIESVHPDLEDVGVISGATRFGAFRRFTMPLITGGIASTVLLLVLLSMRELSASLFLFTSDTVVLSILIFSEWQNGNIDVAAAISLLYSAVLFTLTIVGRRWLVQRKVNP